MIRKLYYWSIPPELLEEFSREWKELTERSQEEFGLISAELFTDDEFIFSITLWNSAGDWERWKSELHTHPFREKWRDYKVGDGHDVRLLARVPIRFESQAVYEAIRAAGSNLLLEDLFSLELVTSEKIGGSERVRTQILRALREDTKFRFERLSDLLLVPEQEYSKVPHLGTQGRRAIKAVLEHYGLRVRP